MNNGEVDFYGISTKIEHDMQAHHYPNVVLIPWLITEMISVLQ